MHSGLTRATSPAREAELSVLTRAATYSSLLWPRRGQRPPPAPPRRSSTIAPPQVGRSTPNAYGRCSNRSALTSLAPRQISSFGTRPRAMFGLTEISQRAAIGVRCRIGLIGRSAGRCARCARLKGTGIANTSPDFRIWAQPTAAPIIALGRSNQIPVERAARSIGEAGVAHAIGNAVGRGIAAESEIRGAGFADRPAALRRA